MAIFCINILLFFSAKIIAANLGRKKDHTYCWFSTETLIIVLKIGKNRQKLPKNDKNRRKYAKIDENSNKSPLGSDFKLSTRLKCIQT
jgi:hypothetical protein